jgi:hypothetical protein
LNYSIIFGEEKKEKMENKGGKNFIQKDYKTQKKLKSTSQVILNEEWRRKI